jgi:hypothetical protein
VDLTDGENIIKWHSDSKHSPINLGCKVADVQCPSLRENEPARKQ